MGYTFPKTSTTNTRNNTNNTQLNIIDEKTDELQITKESASE